MVEMLMKGWPGGLNIILKRNPRLTDESTNIDIDYKFISWEVLIFLSIEYSWSNIPGVTSPDKSPKIVPNIYFFSLYRPHLISISPPIQM